MATRTYLQVLPTADEGARPARGRPSRGLNLNAATFLRLKVAGPK